MKVETAIGEIIKIKSRYYICKENKSKEVHCKLCDFTLFSDACMRFECTRFGRSDKSSIYYERIDPVPMSEVKAVFN